MENKNPERTIKRLRVYLALFYAVMLYGVYCMYMHEYLIMVAMKQPIRRWFGDVWFGIGPLPKLYMVVTLYITLHMAVVGAVSLLRKRRQSAAAGGPSAD
jgi:hypothetical protein